MGNRSFYDDDLYVKTSRANRSKKKHYSNSNDDYGSDTYNPKQPTYKRKEKYNNWKHQTQDDTWEDDQ